jgi:hypothetical protein
MLPKLVPALLAVLLSYAPGLAAADFWQTKQSAQWTEKEAKRLLNDSPWARLASATLGSPPAGAPRARGAGRNVAETSDATQGRGQLANARSPAARYGGGDDAGGGAPAEPMVLVRWESAAPVREAQQKLEQPAVVAQRFAEWAKTFYIVSVSRFPLTVPPGPALDQMVERLAQAASLNFKDKEPLKPARAFFLQDAEGPVFVVLFPRTDEIGMDDKEVSFGLAADRIEFRSKFSLKNMLSKGKLEL